MTKPPATDRGLAVELDDINPTPSVPRTPVIHANHARRVGLHHRLYRHPRHVKALDRFLTPLEPWEHAWPAEDVYADGATSVQLREYRGRCLAESGWSP